jgi:hypothetical protein
MDHLPNNPQINEIPRFIIHEPAKDAPQNKKTIFFCQEHEAIHGPDIKRPGRIDTAESPISIPQNPAALTTDHTRALSSRPRRTGEWNPSNAVLRSGAKEKKRWRGEETVSVAGGKPGRRTGGRHKGRWCG